jgi:signal transduction histidine kinase
LNPEQSFILAAMRDSMRLWASAAAVMAVVIGTAVLTGWVFGIEALKAVYGPITMKTNGAICLLLCGLALWALEREWRSVAACCAVIASAIAGATLSQHLFSWDLGIDQALFSEVPGAAATASPNRMGPHGATSFGLAGVAILLLLRPTRQSVRIVEALCCIGLAFALLAITGYTYGATELFGIAPYTGIALHTAVALFVLHSGLLAATARLGGIAIFVDPGAAGMLSRRLAIPVICLPLLLGYFMIVARERGILDRGLAFATFAVLVIVILFGAIWRTATVINSTDRERQRAREEAERANRLKDQFIAVLSHELRTPLNVMLGRLQLLESEVDRDKRVKNARIVAKNGRLLARLVEDLLDLSRVAAGQFEIAPGLVQLNALIRTALDTLAPEAAAKGVALATTEDPNVGSVRADGLRLHQVISNLVSNAVKFTPAGGQVEVRTTRTANGVTVSVSDTGVGFDSDFASQLFEPFRQADASSTREHGGLGLGLSIARHLVELHGGTIEAASPGPGRGATFTVTLPSLTTEPAPHRRPISSATTAEISGARTG